MPQNLHKIPFLTTYAHQRYLSRQCVSRTFFKFFNELQRPDDGGAVSQPGSACCCPVSLDARHSVCNPDFRFCLRGLLSLHRAARRSILCANSETALQSGLFDTRGRQLNGWTNKLVCGGNKLILSSLKKGPLREETKKLGGLKLIRTGDYIFENE